MALTTLIDETTARNDWNDADVSRRATSRGHKLTKSDVSNYRHRGMPTIVPDKIRALAAGLEVPAYVVVAAVMSDHGVTVPLDGRTPEQVIEADYTLSVHTRRALLLLIEQDRAGRSGD